MTPIDPRKEPESNDTVAMPKVPDWAIELTRSVKAGFVAAEERFDKQDATLLGQGTKLDKVITEGIEANTRMTRFEVRLENLEDRAATTSIKVKGASEVDLEHEAKLGLAIAKTQQLETAIHETRAIVEQQSDFMGIGKKGLEWLRSKEARADIVRVVTLVTAAYVALKQAGVIK